MTHDDKLIDAVAQLWVDSGGDADGLAWCYHKIRDAIEAKLKEKNHD